MSEELKDPANDVHCCTNSKAVGSMRYRCGSQERDSSERNIQNLQESVRVRIHPRKLSGGTYCSNGVQYQVVDYIGSDPQRRVIEVEYEVLVNLVMHRGKEVWRRKSRNQDFERPVTMNALHRSCGGKEESRTKQVRVCNISGLRC